MIDALISFLSARLDEDQAAAKAAQLRFPGPWEQGENAGSPLPSAVTLYDSREESVGVIRGSYAATHIGRHDPARALREVEAKRKRLALMIEAQAALDKLIADDAAPRSDQAMAVGRARSATVAVKIDAEIWSGHPGYKEAWKP